MAAAAGSAPAPVGFKGRRAPVTPRRSERWSSATGSHRASPACHAGVFTGSLADEIETDGFAPPMPMGRRVYSALHCYSATPRKMDLPRGRAPRCPRYQRGASLSTPWQSDGGSCRSRTDLTRLMMPLPQLLGQGTGKCGPPRMCAGFSRLRVGCIAAYACGPRGAGGATCTRTPGRARSFEVRVSTCSTTPAGNGAEGETCTPKAHWLSTRSVCLIPDKPLRQNWLPRVALPHRHRD
jgi:hypothetical protein